MFVESMCSPSRSTFTISKPIISWLLEIDGVCMTFCFPVYNVQKFHIDFEVKISIDIDLSVPYAD